MKLLTVAGDKGLLENISYIVLLALMFLLPIFISPFGLLSFAFAKVFLTVFAVVVAFSLFILLILKKGSITFPKSWAMLTLAAVPLVTLVSALAGGSIQTSLIGYGIELDTFFSVLILFVLLFLVMQVFTSAKKIFYAYIAFALAMLLLFIFHGVRFLAGPEFLSFDLFPLITSNTFGKWNDLAILSGLVVILSALMLETTRVAKRMKLVAYGVFALALVHLAIVNFFLVWVVLGVLALISFVYLFSFGKGEETKRKIPTLSIIVLALSVLFVISGQQISNTIALLLDISVVDVRPLWSSTFEIAQQTFSGVVTTLFGSGPNTFVYQWAQFKPDIVNQTLLWNTDFNYGISYLATTLVTVGVVGALAWIAFLVFFVYQGFMSLFSRKESQNSFLAYLTLSSFVASLFLWTVLLFYVPGIVVIILTFFFTGLFLSTLSVSGILPQKEISFIKSPKVGFAITLSLVFILIAGISLGYLSFQKTLSSVYYQQGLLALNRDGDVVTAGQKISQAVSLAEHDVYYRTLVDLNLFQLNQILSTEDLSTNASVSRAQQTLGLAVGNAQAAINSNPLNYQNHATLAGVYAAVAPLNVEGALQGARSAYQSAIERAPKNPALPLALARLEANQGDMNAAREWINRSLGIKNNYTEAIFTLAQIEVSEGNIEEAIASVEITTLIEPNNATLYFQLGLLYYNDEQFDNAATSFENAITLVPEYANAKYFLGLTYYELNRRSDAINQFLALEETNPDNEEIEFILGNLQAGLPPFDEVQPPFDDEPENREELPLDEEEL